MLGNDLRRWFRQRSGAPYRATTSTRLRVPSSWPRVVHRIFGTWGRETWPLLCYWLVLQVASPSRLGLGGAHGMVCRRRESELVLHCIASEPCEWATDRAGTQSSHIPTTPKPVTCSRLNLDVSFENLPMRHDTACAVTWLPCCLVANNAPKWICHVVRY